MNEEDLEFLRLDNLLDFHCRFCTLKMLLLKVFLFVLSVELEYQKPK